MRIIPSGLDYLLGTIKPSQALFPFSSISDFDLYHAQFLVFVLELVELPANPALGQQFLVAADFAHVALPCASR